MKQVFWMGRSREVIRGFVKSVRAQIGYQLYRVQQGLIPTDWKPMSGIGTGVMEIRIHRPHEHRVIYVAKFGRGLYVLHAFEKKTQKTGMTDREIARRNYEALIGMGSKLKG